MKISTPPKEINIENKEESLLDATDSAGGERIKLLMMMIMLRRSIARITHPLRRDRACIMNILRGQRKIGNYKATVTIRYASSISIMSSSSPASSA